MEQIPDRIEVLKKFGKSYGRQRGRQNRANAVAALASAWITAASYGLMLQRHNQRFPFHFDGAADDPMFYAELKKLTTSSAKPGAEAKARDTISTPESQVAGAGSRRPWRSKRSGE